MRDHYEHTIEDAAEGRVRDFCAGLDAEQSTGQPTRSELLALRLLYGERIREARNLAGMTSSSLAEYLGLELWQVIRLESGRHEDVPAWLLARVATVTGVRLDFLAGLTEETECGEDGELHEIVMAQMLRADTDNAVRALGDAEQQRTIARLERRADRFRLAVVEVVEAFQQFKELNGEQWQDMPGGARLSATVAAYAAGGA